MDQQERQAWMAEQFSARFGVPPEYWTRAPAAWT